MDDSTLKYSALVHEALGYKDSPIYRPTYYKINKTPTTAPYEVTFKNDRKTLWALFGILALVFFLTTVILMCLFVFKVYPIWGDSSDQKIIVYDKNAPVLFLTGYPGSGMKYPREILNSYNGMRCSVDERTIPEFLGKQNSDEEMREIKIGSSSESTEIVDEDLIPNYSASFAYVMETLVSGSQPSKSLCCQVPDVLKWSSYLNRLLPNAKFLLVIRDPRAIALNLARQQKQESNSTFFAELLQDWETSVDTTLTNCRELGPMECLPIYFEQLVIHPDLIIPRIDDFAGFPHRHSQRFEEYFAQLDLDAWRENDVIRQINQSNDTLLQKLYGARKYHQLKSEDLL